MATITDLIIAEPAVLDAQRRGSPIWGEGFRRLEFKGLDNNLLAALWRALDATQDGASLGRGDSIVLGAGEKLVIRLPDDFIRHLGRVGISDVPSVAHRWAAQEGVDLEGLAAEAAEYVLPQLADFARQAISAGKPLLLAMYV